jgi:hypothetical protein
MLSVSQALENARAASSDGHICYQKVADQCNVSRSTVSRRDRGITIPRAEADQQQRKLDAQQERELCAYIEELTERRLPPTRQMIQNFASEIAQERVGDTWVQDFLHRHTEELLYKWTTAMDKVRHAADNSDKYEAYFDLLHSKIKEYNVRSADTYNMDEKGFAIGLVARSKRIFSKRSYEKRHNRQSLQDGNRVWVTLLASVCADGSALPPGLIYPGKDNEIQSSWVEDIEPGKHSVFVTATPSGWTNDKVGLAWLEQLFDRYTKQKARRSWRLLIVDGHGSHITMAFIDYCDRHKILLMVFPPHSTHTLQPLDVGVFSPLAHYYSNEVTAHLHDSQALAGIPKADFFMLFWRAWQRTMRESLIKSAFEATGIWPQDPSVILSRWEDDSDVDDETPPPPAADDWHTIDRLYKSVVGDDASKEARTLRRTLHHLSARCSILEVENRGLSAVVAQQNPSKKKREALDLRHPKKGRREALLYSPSKVRDARHRNKLNETNRLQEEVAKHHRREERAATTLRNKLEKERRSSAYKERLEASKVRKAEEAAEKERKKQERDCLKSTQLLQSGKRKASPRPPPKARTKKACSGSARRGVVVEEPAPAPRTHTTRSGRTATRNY